jgi:hypothetical protein
MCSTAILSQVSNHFASLYTLTSVSSVPHPAPPWQTSDLVNLCQLCRHPIYTYAGYCIEQRLRGHVFPHLVNTVNILLNLFFQHNGSDYHSFYTYIFYLYIKIN